MPWCAAWRCWASGSRTPWVPEQPLCPNGCGTVLVRYSGLHFMGYESLECPTCKEAGEVTYIWERERT